MNTVNEDSFCLIDYPPVGGTKIALDRLNQVWDSFIESASVDEVEQAYKMAACGFKYRDDLCITSYTYDLVASNASMETKMLLAQNLGAKQSYKLLASFNNMQLRNVLLKNPVLDSESLTIMFHYLEKQESPAISQLLSIRRHVNCPKELKAEVDNVLGSCNVY